MIRATSPAAWAVSGSTSSFGRKTTLPALFTVEIPTFTPLAIAPPVIAASPMRSRTSSPTYSPPWTALPPITRPSWAPSWTASRTTLSVAPPPLRGVSSMRPEATAEAKSVAVAVGSMPWSSFSWRFAPKAFVIPYAVPPKAAAVPKTGAVVAARPAPTEATTPPATCGAASAAP